MSLITSPLDIFDSLLIFFLGFFLSQILRKKFNTNKRRAAILYIWHTFFCFLYANYVIQYGGDSRWYYQYSFTEGLDFSLGTLGVVVITGFFSSVLNLSFLATFFAFNIFGYIGLLAFDSCLRNISINKPKFIQSLCTLIIFLPSVSFWSSNIGKDSISFMAVGLALWSTTQKNKHYSLLLTSIIVMLIVRPHIAALMAIAFVVSMALQSGISFFQRVILFSLGATLAAVLVPLAIDTSGLSELDRLNEYIEQRQSYNQTGGGGIDISSMSAPLKLFTYLFRPLPFEAHSIFALAASVDNIILLGLFIFGIISLLKYKKQENFYENSVFLWIYVIITWLTLSFTTANLGISLRQKWMFTPILIYLLISAIGRRYSLKKNNYKE